MQSAEGVIDGKYILETLKRHIEENPHEDPVRDARWHKFLNKEIGKHLPRVQISMQNPGTGVVLDLSGFDIAEWVSKQHLLV